MAACNACDVGDVSKRSVVFGLQQLEDFRNFNSKASPLIDQACGAPFGTVHKHARHLVANPQASAAMPTATKLFETATCAFMDRWADLRANWRAVR